MSNGNPFYVHPGGDYTRGLAGLSTAVNRAGEIKREAAEKQKQEEIKQAAIEKFAVMKQGALEAYQSGDPDTIAEFALANPEIGQALHQSFSFKNKITEENYRDSLFNAYLDPSEENVKAILEKRQGTLKGQGVAPDGSKETDSFMEKFDPNDPEGTKKKIAETLAFMYPDKWKKYKEATLNGIKESATPGMKEYGLAKEQGFKGTFLEYKAKLKETPKKEVLPKPYTDAAKLNADYKAGLITKEQYTAESAKAAPESSATPYTDLAKIKKDLNNKLISDEDYIVQRDKLLNKTAKNKIELTRDALNGDPEALAILNQIKKDDVAMAKAKGSAAAEGKIAGLHKSMDLDSTAQAVYEGRETISRVKNTFGVPIQEVVRQKVLAMDPTFNFLQPDATYNSLKSSLQQQQKNRGAMGSFVQNINGQVDELTKIGNDMVSRIGVRAMDIPIRKLKTSVVGSGQERVFEAYMKEISAEIYKLSQGSTASVAMLPEQGRKEWEKIHDVNLNMKQLRKVLEGTREMANIRLKSVDDEITRTTDKMGSVIPAKTSQATTQAAIEEMPSGSIFIGPDGKQYRKR